jgi:alcohol dehydrogenase
MAKIINEILKVTGPKVMSWEKEPLTPPKTGELLVKTTATAVSIASELALFRKYAGNHAPVQSGYESVGEVIEKGSGTEYFNIGDKVLSFYGHQSYAALSQDKVIKIPAYISSKTALLNILSCDAAKGVTQMSPSIDDNIIITGAGTMGLLTLFYLKHKYHINNVDIIEPNSTRHSIAKILGARYIYTQVSEKMHASYDCGFECADHDQAFNDIQHLVKLDASICVLSDGNLEHFTLYQPFFDKGLHIYKSNDGHNYQTHADWLFSLEANKLKLLDQIFDMTIQKDDLVETFKALDTKTINPVKIFVSYP